MDLGNGIAVLLVAIVIWVALFLVFRQFMLWYFRINERTELLRDIRDSLRQRAPHRIWEPDPQLARASEADAVRRRPGASQG